MARTEEKYMVAYIVNVRNAEIGSDVTRMDDFRSVRMSLWDGLINMAWECKAV